MILIGAGSRARQGKSLFCKTIIEHCDRTGIKWREYSISDAILRYCIDREILPDVRREVCTPEQVQVLVEIGNAKRRDNENFWIDEIHTEIVNDKPAVALIPNVRFPSETEFVKEMDGFNALNYCRQEIEEEKQKASA